MEDHSNQINIPFFDVPIEELKEAIAYLAAEGSPAVRYGGVLRTIGNSLIKAANAKTGEDHKPRAFMTDAEKGRQRMAALKSTMSRDINQQRSEQIRAILAGKKS